MNKFEVILEDMKSKPHLFSESEIGMYEDSYKFGFTKGVRAAIQVLELEVNGDDRFDGPLTNAIMSLEKLITGKLISEVEDDS